MAQLRSSRSKHRHFVLAKKLNLGNFLSRRFMFFQGKNYDVKKLVVVAGVLFAAASPASATVLTFDNLSGSGVLADGYGGINWGGIWNYYDSDQTPYTPESPPERIYATLGTQLPSFSFIADSVFSGVYVSGLGSVSGPIGFNLYLGGNLVGTSSGTVDPSSTPTLLSSAYFGKVDTVQFTGSADYYTLDNVAFNTSTVPLPASAPMFGAALMALGAVGYGMKRKAKAAA
ncbi:hypothetical protein [Lichenifustis flavocetrariae]|uniref:VPLPA-CTERM sorting domain-containing protein n=1 Tax=Lichenifustis flavocetrariae TaxID=2949735 RepID=A0AA41YT24_9HYPH|nr:hypothetical protein [Lichenifustis flavocetrariae]MCW6506686.1 hypothetical protein [Lichenifustis flavocetrariae]